MITTLILIGLIIVSVAVIWTQASKYGRLKAKHNELYHYSAAQQRVIGALKKAIERGVNVTKFAELVDMADTADKFNRLYEEIRRVSGERSHPKKLPKSRVSTNK